MLFLQLSNLGFRGYFTSLGRRILNLRIQAVTRTQLTGVRNKVKDNPEKSLGRHG